MKSAMSGSTFGGNLESVDFTHRPWKHVHKLQDALFEDHKNHWIFGLNFNLL